MSTQDDAQPTPGPWMAGHFVDAEHSCDCQYILQNRYIGAIATVHADGHEDVPDKISDYPSEDEAKANMRLIAAAGTAADKAGEMAYDPHAAVRALPSLLLAAKQLLDSLNNHGPYNPKREERRDALQNALASAEGGDE